LQGVSSLGGVKQRWGGNYFEAKCVNISKTVGFASKFTINNLYALSIDTKIDDFG